MHSYKAHRAFLIMSYPHFLFADVVYRDSVLGMHPNEENHKIFIELEPNTGTPIRGAKRAQFNIFSRPVRNIPVSQKLRTALVPILWIEEAIDLPHEFVDELTERLLSSLQLVDIFIPVIIAACAIVLAIDLPHEFVDELTERLLSSLQLVDIFIPVIIAACAIVLVLGLSLTIAAKLKKK
uniref:Sensory neuron membrane protein 2 n=1 Tax=Heliothis virescens TaxID=7102 RepID=A0A2A4J5Z2_HELVI